MLLGSILSLSLFYHIINVENRFLIFFSYYYYFIIISIINIIINK